MASVLTAASVERFKPIVGKRLEMPDAALPGLYLVVQESGSKSWALRYRHAGRPRKLTIGRYPGVTLVGARDLAREALQRVARGTDPGAEKVEAKRQAREVDPDRDLVSGAVQSYFKRHVRPNTSRLSVETTERLFNKHILPRWKDRRLDDIRRRDVIALLDQVIDGGAPVGANRVFSVARHFFGWCVKRGMLEVSPCLGVTAPTEESARDRVLTDEELRLVWLASFEIGTPFGPFVRTLILTAARRDEVAQMRRAEIRGDLWTIPAERTKNGIANDVPLTATAIASLADAPVIQGRAGYVFTTTGETPVSGYSRSKTRLDREMLAIARKEADDSGLDPAAVKLEPWRLHDLRRTAATGMAKAGQPVHVIEAVLNHVSGQISGVAAVYNRHRYLDEKRTALDAWAQHVLKNTEGFDR